MKWQSLEKHHVNFISLKANALKAGTQFITDIASTAVNMCRELKYGISIRKNSRSISWDISDIKKQTNDSDGHSLSIWVGIIIYLYK